MSITRASPVLGLLALCLWQCLWQSGHPALADNFSTPLGGPSPGVVVERRQGTSGNVNVPVDESNPLPVAANAASPLHTVIDNGGTAPIGGSTGSVATAPPDASTVTTGGTAVTAFAAGHVTRGGYLNNPALASAPLCINISGTASTTDGGGTSCILAGQSFTIPTMLGAVSVNATNSGHVFSGAGYQ